MSSALLIAAALGCSPPPDTSPVVMITAPIADQTLPAGQAIDVRFSVGGIDASGPTMMNFQLSGGSTMQYGKGKVRAFLNSSGFLAQTATIPNDANPFLVPNALYGDPATYVRSGTKATITLQLYYNSSDGNDVKVDPQREGTVTVNIQ